MLGIFKFKSDGTSPAFLNTFAVLITYVVISLFYIKQVQVLPPEQREDIAYCMNLLMDSFGVSTITYALGVIVQNFASLKKGDPVFSSNSWLLFWCIIYIVAYGLFIPRHIGLNIFLAVFTVFMVILASRCVFKTSESGQAKSSKIDKGEISACPPAKGRRAR